MLCCTAPSLARVTPTAAGGNGSAEAAPGPRWWVLCMRRASIHRKVVARSSLVSASGARIRTTAPEAGVADEMDSKGAEGDGGSVGGMADCGRQTAIRSRVPGGAHFPPDHARLLGGGATP